MLKKSYATFRNLVALRDFTSLVYHTRTKHPTISLNHIDPQSFVMDRSCVLCEGGM